MTIDEKAMLETMIESLELVGRSLYGLKKGIERMLLADTEPIENMRGDACVMPGSNTRQ